MKERPTCDKARKRGIHPGFETQGRRNQKSKTGVLVAPQKGLVSSKIFFFLKNRYNERWLLRWSHHDMKNGIIFNFNSQADVVVSFFNTGCDWSRKKYVK